MNGIFGNQRDMGVFGPQYEPMEMDPTIGQNMGQGMNPQSMPQPAPQRGFMGGIRDIFGRAINFSSSPYGAAAAASLSRGEPLAEASFQGQQYSQHQKALEQHKKMQEEAARRQAEIAHYQRMRDEKNDYFSNTLKAAQANKAMAPDQRQITQGADGYKYYQDDGSRVLPGVKVNPKAPRLETIYGDDGKEFKGQWNPETQDYDRVGGFKTTGTQITPSQDSNNKEIERARKYLLGLPVPEGSDLASEVQRMGVSMQLSGRENPDYNPFIDRLMRQAGNRMIGEDPGYDQFLTKIMGPRWNQAAVNTPGNSHAQVIEEARAAIAQGAPREKVLERLQKMGVENSGL